MTEGLWLYSYWRSSAAYRVRIALNLKGLLYKIIPVHLVHNGGEQHSDEFRSLNPQRMVPTLIDGRRVIRQSLTIVEYLDEAYDGDMSLLPSLKRDRARVRALAQLIACDVHPLNNLRVMQYLENELSIGQVERDRWMQHWMTEGFAAFEQLLADSPSTGSFCEGDRPSLADICLVPQVYNGYRFKVDMTRYPIIERIYRECLSLPQVDAAQPENQPDAPAAA